MTASEAVTVFVDERLFRVRPGLPVAQAAALACPDLAVRLETGTAYLTDGRGIRLAGDAPVQDGSIIRIVRTARTRDPEADAHS